MFDTGTIDMGIESVAHIILVIPMQFFPGRLLCFRVLPYG